MNPAGVLFVVVEAGGQWPAWLSKLQRVVHDVVVVAAYRDGTPAELALRVLHRLQALEASKDRAQMAVVLAGTSSAHDEVFEARCLMARALLRHMAADKTGKLVYSATSTLTDDSRHELMALVGTLTEQLIGTQMSISVRFGSPEDSRAVARRPSKAGIGRVA
jgi:hypothetical protein